MYENGKKYEMTEKDIANKLIARLRGILPELDELKLPEADVKAVGTKMQPKIRKISIADNSLKKFANSPETIST